MKLVSTGIRENSRLRIFAFLLSFLTFAWTYAGDPGHGHGDQHEDSTHESAGGHGDEHEDDGEFTAAKMSSMIMHHIADAHEWHFFTIGHTHVTLPLPVILYSEQHGLDVFLSSKFHHNHGVYKHYKLDHHGKIVLVNEAGEEVMEEVAVEQEDGTTKMESHVAHPMDFSFTKNVASMMIAFLLMAWIFITAAKGYKKRAGQAPKGIQSFVEPLILFVRDEIARPNLGRHAGRFTPYLLSLFFFIWINNLLGLLPGAANVTGNIAVTLMLALLTLLLTNFNGNKGYWSHIFWPPGMPVLVKFMVIPVELISIISKPFALMIRLFANITAGHILIMSILSLIFLFSDSGRSLVGGFGVSAVSVPFAAFLYTLELLVAAIQAFIFTMLTALFIGQAMPEEHH